MKKAFTIIELIFVIVALGILAMVATPRLVSSKEDAEITRVKSEIAAIRSAIQTHRGANLLKQDGSGYPRDLRATTIEDITNGTKLSQKYWSVSRDGSELNVTIGGRTATFTYNNSTGRLTCPNNNDLCRKIEN
ncbi:prepilin-type N-terminal cleavage/methylation domain-containing protein [Campylobacter sp.]|uniref:prepilin-type N-terminal cleavage/methylation domain-containing protein n=1 Tax=Campylobacter sp. TaxID=205 RepID=UPI002AA63577|nr:prepilin-type N-terminal cleavage/methylation domain-containing protein [Campylobacter sp.]MCI6662335.1 type II secretion system GspH family protein [Campylobacter sp.]MCI7550389.1 type II secretion system GspH family protein [Campylobacter sp.]